jgi:hypothetical protein
MQGRASDRVTRALSLPIPIIVQDLDHILPGCRINGCKINEEKQEKYRNPQMKVASGFIRSEL